MNFRKLSKIISIIAIFAMVLSFAACRKEGSLKLESFTIDRTSIKTTYLVGEEVDFSGIKAVARYSDESLNKIYTYDELTLTYPEDITATAGDKEVTVSFNDPNLNKKQETKFTVKVTENSVIDDGSNPLVAVQFEKPTTLTQFDSANAAAGTIQYGSAGFWGQFAAGQKTYVIGNENEFKLNPQFAVLTDDGTVVELTSFFSVVDVYVEKTGEYVALTKTEGENNVVTYTDGETLIATVDTYNGLYQFTTDAAGLKVKISVLPKEANYITSTPFNPVVLEANIINAYNVYEAWQLAVIDNFREAWLDIKTEHGLLDVNASGVVFHNDITLTAADVPAEYFYTTEREVVYTNAVDGSTVTIPAGTKYLKDLIEIYYHLGLEPFAMEGNFFTLDTSKFPIIASPAVFGEDAEKDYDTDFSNTALFFFNSYESTEDFIANMNTGNGADVTINNLSFIGNAKRDNLVDANENLASAGGLILIKSMYKTDLTMDNIIGNSYFISYFADNGNITVNNAKCFDSYQNAAFVWGASITTFTNSYLEGCGGPVAIVQSLIDEGWHPVFSTTNTHVKTNVTGEEIWFSAVGANSMVGGIKGLGEGLNQAGLGNFVDAQGKMNIKGVLMASGTNASAAVTGIGAQGSIAFDGEGMNRYQTVENANWATIKYISEQSLAGSGQIPPFFTVYDANGVAQTIFFNGTTFVDLSMRPLGTNVSHAELVAAFQAADTITLTQGGLSIVFDFYHN